ncbi:MAG TPA: Rieske 2Fe-2S domain-containing protein [Acidimicrobiales bacterium]|nr:Rieske 2Fe-2S domain-containing protein [Acidimicrobiales bacterium]
MLTREENEYLCRIGPGTAMGNVMRRYWVPAIQRQDLPAADGDPVPFQVLGERLVAFRDSEGRVGVLEEACCHRGASLALGRVEDCGIRCLYHGWKFGVDGRIQETPNMPDSKFKERVRAPSYPVREAGGLVWVYMGPSDRMPPFPAYNWLGGPGDEHFVREMVVSCNWAQVLEGLLDSSHVGVLHRDEMAQITAGRYNDTTTGGDGYPTTDNAPKIEVRNTDFGFDYAAIRSRSDGGDGSYVRVTAFMMPFFCYIPPRNSPRAAIVVPRDDVTTSQFSVTLLDGASDVATLQELLGFGDAEVLGPDRRVRVPPQDRGAMARGESFAGIPGIPIQDVAVQESMGPLYDRSREHVVPADLAVLRMRRLFLAAAAQVEAGEDPVGLDRAVDTGAIDRFGGIVPPGARWQDMVPGNQALDTTGSSRADRIETRA